MNIIYIYIHTVHIYIYKHTVPIYIYIHTVYIYIDMMALSLSLRDSYIWRQGFNWGKKIL